MASVKYVRARDADLELERVCAGQLPVTARAIAQTIPQEIPVHHGVALRLTRVFYSSKTTLLGKHPIAEVRVQSPFWHFLEYGTRFNPPYRPIQRACEGLGLEYESR